MAASYTSVTQLKTFMGVSDTNDDAAFTAVATAVNAFIEDWIGFPATAASSAAATAARTYDGSGGESLFIRGGVTGLEKLEVADQTGGTFTETTDYVLRPYTYDRPSGWPAWFVDLTDLATTTYTIGYETVRLTPGTAGVWYFDSMPAELSRIADILGARMFQSRQSGEMMVVGSTDFGQAIVRFLAEPEYRDALDHYAFTLGGKRRAF
jgi:hypothetical protein